MFAIFMYREDTIAAIATPMGEGCVAIVRISGPDAERIAREIFQRGGGNNGSLRSHTLHHGAVRDPKTSTVLDDALLVLMRKPRSYTGEDVVEVHCHGGPYLVRQILEVILGRGARYAEPGEFTKRAFLNGRLDLAQAEGVLDLIRARTDTGARIAFGQLHGQFSRWVAELREELLDILVQVEAAIDFPEEEIELLRRDELSAKVEGLRKKIGEIIRSYDWARLFREGARVCIAGRPNVGKSSLFNALLGEARVIVTPVPGTTRDIIEESLNLGGLPVVLWDTAGIRDTEDQVERIGVDLSLTHIERADAVLAVIDNSEPATPEDRSVLESIRGKRGMIVVNKADLQSRIDLDWLGLLASGKEVMRVSAKTGDGLQELKRSLRALLLGTEIEPQVVVTNVRHKAALERGEANLIAANGALSARLPPEIVAVDLQSAKEALEEIIGIVTNDNILERVFSQFCLGK
jgi:tRNA modification GTPase